MSDRTIIPSYYATIPATVRYDQRLSPNAKLLYGEITALCNLHGYCWSKNIYFANLYQKSKQTISGWISQLKAYNYITTEVKYYPNSREIEERIIRLIPQEGIKENHIPPIRKIDGGIKENLKDNITSINKVTKVTNGSSKLPYTKEDIFRYKTILKQTVIDIGDFRTNINTDTKTMKRVFKYMYEIEHNLFLPGKTLGSPLLAEMDVTRIDRIMTPKQLQLILKKAARNWRSYYTDKNIITPEKRPSLDAWFYSPPPNSKQGMSWFLYCATDSFCETGDVKSKKMLENIKIYLEKFVEDPQKLSEILYNKSEQKKWSEGDHITFFSTIKQIIAWRAENREKLSKNNEGWGTYFGSIEKTFTTISIFLEDCFPNPNPRFLAVDGWNWNQFVNYIDNSYDINLRS